MVRPDREAHPDRAVRPVDQAQADCPAPRACAETEAARARRASSGLPEAQGDRDDLDPAESQVSYTQRAVEERFDRNE